MKRLTILLVFIFLTILGVGATEYNNDNPYLVNLDELPDDEKRPLLQPYLDNLKEELREALEDNDFSLWLLSTRYLKLYDGNQGIKVLVALYYPDEYVYSDKYYSKKQALNYLEKALELVKSFYDDSFERWQINVTLQYSRYGEEDSISETIASKLILYSVEEKQWVEIESY